MGLVASQLDGPAYEAVPGRFPGDTASRNLTPMLSWCPRSHGRKDSWLNEHDAPVSGYIFAKERLTNAVCLYKFRNLLLILMEHDKPNDGAL